MSKRARRILFTLAVCVFAALIVWVVVYGKSRLNRMGQAPTNGTNVAQQQQPAASQPAGAAPTSTAPATTASATGPAAPATSPSLTTAPAIPGLRAVAPGNDLGSRAQGPAELGSLDPRRDVLHVRLSRFGAGIERIEFSNMWQTSLARRQAAKYLKEIGASGPLDPACLPQSDRYVLAARSPSKVFDSAGGQWLYSGVPIMACRWLTINGTNVDLLNDDAWSETAPGVFESRIVDDAGEPVAHVTRRYALSAAGFDISLEQRIRNLTGAPIEIRWQQYGPVDLPEDATGYIPRRRLHFGYLPDPLGRPTMVLADDKHVLERSSAIKQYQRGQSAATAAQRAESLLLWPTADTRAASMGMSWFATTNRYFGLAVHPPLAGDVPAAYSIENSINEVELGVSNVGVVGSETLYTVLRSPAVSVAPGAEQAFDVAIYAGPLDRHALDQGAFSALRMTGMIIYSMAGCCTFLTFQWLAHLLLWFLGVLHDFVFFDWALAIIGLVIVVRTLLHPLTKKSQVNMMRFGKQMQGLKPELDKLQKKFGGDKQKMQQEQMRLMREHHINPLQMLGCLPMFLQMPIWIALWASLYLAFDLRQQPAFYGVFQMIAEHWPFLADLSGPDSFISFGTGFKIPLLGTIRGINILPILMGIVFFIQQKYMTPPTTANMTPEQIQQQKIMKWMMVILFPVMMYNTPSGLTLYILTSTTVGILESRYIRRHIDQMDVSPQAKAEKAAKPKGSLGRAWAKRLEAIREKQRMAKQEQRSFKKRK